MTTVHWERLASILICIAFGILFFDAFFHYLLPILLPFLVAWLLSLIIRPLAKQIAKITRTSEKPWAVLLLILLLGGLALFLGFAISRGLRELKQLATRLLMENGGLEGVLSDSVSFIEGIGNKIGLLPSIGGEEGAIFREKLNEMTVKLLEGMLTSLSEAIPKVATAIITALPTILLMTLITVIAGFYFCLDGERIVASITGLLPLSIGSRIERMKNGAKRVSFRYVRAYLLLLLIVFCLLFIGFSVLRVEYAFLLAIFVAIVDLLPVLGVGTVLLPWAAVLLLQKNYYLGFGLIILYGAVLIVRQILEPRLVGVSLGLHPLLTLFAGYAGLRLFGVIGMLIAPFVAMIARLLLLQRKHPKETASPQK